MIKQEAEDTDHITIKQILDGSVNEYRLLIEKYQVPVFNLLLQMMNNRHQAEELTQQAFTKAYEALPDFRFEHRFFSWLYRISINLALNELKKRRKNVGIESIENLTENTDENRNETQILIMNSVNKLKDIYRIVIVLKYYQDMSYKEMAETLHLSEKKIRSRLYDARIQLKMLLEKTGYY